MLFTSLCVCVNTSLCVCMCMLFTSVNIWCWHYLQIMPWPVPLKKQTKTDQTDFLQVEKNLDLPKNGIMSKNQSVVTEWPVSCTCHCGDMGVEWTLNKSLHRKFTLGKKNSLCSSCWESNPQPFGHESSILPTELSWLRILTSYPDFVSWLAVNWWPKSSLNACLYLIFCWELPQLTFCIFCCSDLITVRFYLYLCLLYLQKGGYSIFNVVYYSTLSVCCAQNSEMDTDKSAKLLTRKNGKSPWPCLDWKSVLHFLCSVDF